MPDGNQGKPQDQGRQNGGVREGAQRLGEQVQQGAAQVGHRLRENVDVARDEAARRYRRAEGMMARNPAPSVLIGFGIGFGLGLVLTTLLTQHEETWADRHLPDSLRHLPDSLHGYADTIRRRMPDTVHDLADSVKRHIPDSVASYVRR